MIARTQKLLAIAATFVLACVATYAFYYVPKVEAHSRNMKLLLQQSEASTKLLRGATELSTLQSLEQELRERLALRLRRLTAPPTSSELLGVLTRPLSELELSLASYTPGSEFQESTDGIQRETFQLSFQAPFKETVQVLDQWEQLPFEIRFDKVSLAPLDAREPELLRVSVLGHVLSYKSAGRGS